MALEVNKEWRFPARASPRYSGQFFLSYSLCSLNLTQKNTPPSRQKPALSIYISAGNLEPLNKVESCFISHPQNLLVNVLYRSLIVCDFCLLVAKSYGGSLMVCV